VCDRSFSITVCDESAFIVVSSEPGCFFAVSYPPYDSHVLPVTEFERSTLEQVLLLMSVFAQLSYRIYSTLASS